MNWKNRLMNGALGIDNIAGNMVFRLRKKLKLNSPVILVPFRSYGRADYLYIFGRVLESKMIDPSHDRQSLLNNIKNMYRRFQSDEVPGVKIEIEYHGEKHIINSDREGYFRFSFTPKHIPNDLKLYHQVSLRILEAPIPFKDETFIAEVMVPPTDAEYGIISDIDDTIVETSATQVLKMAKTVFLNNAHSRMAFPGVSAFYNALMLGKNGKRNNPFFYVSSSPWNMYDLLSEFLDLNKIPVGPLLLRDFGINDNKLISSGHMGHKTKEIFAIMETYPQLKFVLIGDSGQQDIYIYTEVAKKYPNRIKAIFIRDLELMKTNDAVYEQVSLAKSLGIEINLIKDAEIASKLSAEKGLIYQEAVEDVTVDKKQDTGEIPGKKEEVII